MNRRRLVQTSLLAMPTLAMAQSPAAPRAALRFGTTPVFLDDQVGFLARWAAYLSAAVGIPVEFVSRRSYRDIMGLLRSQELEAAWICGFQLLAAQQTHDVAVAATRNELDWYADGR